jgi:hypothetical protein
VDLSSICYEHDPMASVNKGLWANFATKSAEGAGPSTMANVAARALSGGSLASETLRHLARPGHNVAVVVPADAMDVQVLSKTDHIEAFRSSGTGGHKSSASVVFRSDPRVAPTDPAQFPAANTHLRTFPTTTRLVLGSLQGSGIYVSKLAYELKGSSASTQSTIMHTFVGLIASEGTFKAWMSGLWSGGYQQILSAWGRSTNVVLADGVDHGGFTEAVIEQNGR